MASEPTDTTSTNNGEVWVQDGYVVIPVLVDGKGSVRLDLLHATANTSVPTFTILHDEAVRVAQLSYPEQVAPVTPTPDMPDKGLL